MYGTQHGNGKVYAFLILGLCFIAYFAYMLIQPVATPTLSPEQELQQYYTKGEDGVYVYGADAVRPTTADYLLPRTYPRDVSIYGDVPAPAGTAHTGDSGVTAPRESGASREVVPIDTPVTRPTPTTPTAPVSISVIDNTNTAASANINSNTNIGANTAANNNAQPSTSAGSVTIEPIPTEETVLFESKIINRLSFRVPAQSTITESGTPRSFTITIDASHAVGSTIKEEIYTMRIRRDVDQCQDILYSFAIDPTLGVDYRIIHSQKQSALKNTYRVIQAHEEFGTYAGNMGIRTVACVQSALPAKIEIQSSGFKRNEINDGFTVMGAMIDSLEI
jgi:hypothetical protein